MVEFHPAYSVRHGLHDDGGGHHWYLQRRPSPLPNDDGADVMISLVDRDMNPRAPSVDTLSVSLTCTNRDLPSALPFGGEDSRLQPEQGGVIASARLLKKPSATWRAPMRLANQWRLISHLAQPPVDRRWRPRGPAGNPQPSTTSRTRPRCASRSIGITDVAGSVGHPHRRAPRQAFVRGTEVELSFDENQYVGAGAVPLMACVLDRFFGLYCTANLYTRLSGVSLQREGWTVRFRPQPAPLA